MPSNICSVCGKTWKTHRFSLLDHNFGIPSEQQAKAAVLKEALTLGRQWQRVKHVTIEQLNRIRETENRLLSAVKTHDKFQRMK